MSVQVKVSKVNKSQMLMCGNNHPPLTGQLKNRVIKFTQSQHLIILMKHNKGALSGLSTRPPASAKNQEVQLLWPYKAQNSAGILQTALPVTAIKDTLDTCELCYTHFRS